MMKGSVRAASRSRCFGSCLESRVRRWLRVVNPALTIGACCAAIVIRVISKRCPTHESATLFCLIADLTLVMSLTLISTGASDRTSASSSVT